MVDGIVCWVCWCVSRLFLLAFLYTCMQYRNHSRSPTSIPQAAAACLCRVLDHPPPLPSPRLLSAIHALPPSAMASLEGLPTMAALLHDPAYRPALVQGLMLSMGGVDPHLSRTATAAVHATCDASDELWPAVVEACVATWRRHARAAGMGATMPRAAVQLLAGRLDGTATSSTTDGQLERETSHAVPGAVLEELVALCRAETKGCRDVARLLACGELLCLLVGAPACCRLALQGAVAMLVSRFPKVCVLCVVYCTNHTKQVRSHCAEQLYVQLLALPAEAEAALGVCADDKAACQELLLGAAWGAGDEGAVARLCELLGLEVVKGPGGGEGGEGGRGCVSVVN